MVTDILSVSSVSIHAGELPGAAYRASSSRMAVNGELRGLPRQANKKNIPGTTITSGVFRVGFCGDITVIQVLRCEFQPTQTCAMSSVYHCLENRGPFHLLLVFVLYATHTHQVPSACSRDQGTQQVS